MSRPGFEPHVGQPPSAFGAAPVGGVSVVPADPAQRLGARLLDGLLAFVLMGIAGITVTLIFTAIYRGEPEKGGALFGVPLVVAVVGSAFFYEWFQVARWGATIGKRVVGIKVVRASDGRPVTAGRAALRAFCFSPGIYHVPNYIPVLGQLNLLWMLWDKPLRQCLHDKAAKTVVVRGTVAPPPPVRLNG